VNQKTGRSENGQPAQPVRCHFCGEASGPGIYKDQQAETFISKEATEPVRTVEQAFFPLDEQLRLQPGGLTPLQLQHLAHFASLHSFEQAANMLKQHHGVQVSASTSRRQTEELGASAEAVQNAQAMATLGQKDAKPKTEAAAKEAVKQVMSSDGAYISLRGKVWAEVKTVLIGEVQENTRPSTERPDQEVKTTNISYFSRMTDSDTFSELATGELDRRGCFEATQVCAVQDGAEWIQRLIDAHRADAVRILDLYHAASYLSDIATLLTNAGMPLAQNWVEEQLHELKHHGPANVLAEVGQLLKDHPDVEELNTKVHYLQKREPLMDYPRFQRQGWPIGSGSVESANTCVVQARLKGPGMHWERRNVNHMLALRTGVCNDRWEETMQQASQHRLLTRRARRLARQKNRYEQMMQQVKRLVLPLFFLLPHPRLKTRHIPASLPQRELLASSSCATASGATRRPAPSHPWRRYPCAKK
jgi:hypothetical protein